MTETKFIQISVETLSLMAKAEFTASEYRLYHYLCKLDPYGNSYKDLPDMLTVMAEVDISQATFYRAIAKFKELGLFDIQPKGFHVRNLHGTKTKEFSSMRKKFSNLRKPESNLIENPQECEKQEPKPLIQGSSSTPNNNKEIKKFNKEKPILKQNQEQIEPCFDEWYESAYTLGQVSNRDGANVQIKRGIYEGRYFYWKDVANNLEQYLAEPVPLQKGQYLTALDEGLKMKQNPNQDN